MEKLLDAELPKIKMEIPEDLVMLTFLPPNKPKLLLNLLENMLMEDKSKLTLVLKEKEAVAEEEEVIEEEEEEEEACEEEPKSLYNPIE